MDIIKAALELAHEAHAGQVRKYTDHPYIEHPLEVAGLVAFTMDPATIAAALLHDAIEDTEVDHARIARQVDPQVADYVLWLSDLEQGNRKARKQLSRERLAKAPAAVQSVKVADLISNTRSIVIHDPKFARVYLHEKQQLLDVLAAADPWLLSMARSQVAGPNL